jgi:hypothetical protein
VLAPRAKLSPRIVPTLPESAAHATLPESAAHACASPSSPRREPDKPRAGTRERPPPRDRTGPVIPAELPVSATTLARTIAGADVPMPNVLSAKHLGRIGGGLLYAESSNVPGPRCSPAPSTVERTAAGAAPVTGPVRSTHPFHPE